MTDQHPVEAEHLKLTSQRAHRALALQMLYALDRTAEIGTTPEELLAKLVQNYELEATTDTFAFRLVSGVLAHEQELLAQIAGCTKNWRMERIGCLTKIVLLIALFEVTAKLTPASVAIDEAIELAKSFCEQDAYKFVNGILDRVLKANKPSCVEPA